MGPRTLTRRMSKAKSDKRSKVKPFLKRINYNHIMPTRYQVTDIDLKGINISDVGSSDYEKKRANLKNLKAVFEQRYKDQSKPTKGGKKDAKASRSETGRILVCQAAILSISAWCNLNKYPPVPK